MSRPDPRTAARDRGAPDAPDRDINDLNVHDNDIRVDDIHADDIDDIDDVDVLVVGAGISGLGFVSFLRERRPEASVLVVDAADEPGGYCRTVKRAGFVWDYSGHFFHFRHKDLEERLVSRIGRDRVRTVVKRARVRDAAGVEVSFPYQRALFELPPPVAQRALVELWQAEQQEQQQQQQQPSSTSFRAMLAARLGPTLCERFLVPYNEKLYATDLDALDAGCMGRFFPHTRFSDVMRAAAAQLAPSSAGAGSGGTDGTYNETFTYPVGGAVEYVNALLPDVPAGRLLLNTRLIHVDRAAHVATLASASASQGGRTRRVRYRALVSSAPLPTLARACDVDVDVPGAFRGNRVLVFNLGFDRKGRDDLHWLYCAERHLPFYRVGFYDNIFGDDRMSLYVEVGCAADGAVDVDAVRSVVLQGLQDIGIITTQKLIAEHHVLMDPAYVHLTPAGIAATAALLPALAHDGVHSIGRYGAWTYCSIEDNLLQARSTAALVDDALRGPR